MRAVVVDIVGKFLAIVTDTANAAADACLAVVVRAEVLRVGQHSFEELQRHNLHLHGLIRIVGKRSRVFDFVDAAHAKILDTIEISEILLTESHPETSALDGGIVEHQAFDFLVVKQVAFARSDFGIGERLVYFERFGFHPLAVFPIQSLLSNLSDIDFGVEVSGESLVVVTRVAVDDIEILNFLEVMLCSISSVDTCHTRVETAAEDSSKAGFFETFAISPLPAIFEVRLVARFVVSSVEIVDATFQTSVHDSQVLIRQRHVNNDVGTMLFEEFNQLRHAIGVDSVGGDVRSANSLSHGVAFAFGARSDDDLFKHVGILGTLVSHNGSYTSTTDNQYFTHFFLVKK